MPEDRDDNILAFKAAKKTKPSSLGIDALDATLIGGVLGALLFAVGIIGEWIPANTYTVAAAACSAIAAVAAKVIKATRSG